MAHISLSVSIENGSSIIVGKHDPGSGIVGIDITTIIGDEEIGTRQVYSKDWLTIHGTDDALRAFAERILAALEPAERHAQIPEPLRSAVNAICPAASNAAL